ncbi:MAG: hypothetical protein RL266_567 [Bacteroidota bacterium]|jgi:capsular polysaccharide biosynthesis protein
MNWNQRIKSLFWKIDDNGNQPIHHIEIKPFENEPTDFGDHRVDSAVKYHNDKWFHNELVVKAQHATVEPQYAYAVNGLRSIIGASIRTRNNLPSPLPLIRSKLLHERAALKKAVLFDGSMGGNYMHFFSDVFHKIYLLERFTELDCPILVGPAVFGKSMMGYIMKESPYRHLQWMCLKQPVLVEELWIARPMPYKAEYFHRTKRFFIEKDLPRQQSKYIFLNRIGTSRCILNFSEIQKVLERNNVEVLATEKLSMKEQAQVFNLSARVIGIHGAAFTNLLYCNYAETKVLELCSANRIGTQFYWLSTALGMDWNMMLGSDADENQSFTLDPFEFERRLIEFLS